MIATSPASFGFGDYILPHERNFDQMQTSAKVQKVFLSLFYGALTLVSIVIIPASLPLAVIGAVTFSYLMIKTLLALVGTFYRSPPLQDLFPIQTTLPPLNQLVAQPCSGFATENGIESQGWKLNLIRSARHTIFISGCYCGGNAFDETLDLIRERMRLIPHLKTSLLSSNVFITAENKKRIDEMNAEFKDRFICTITSEVFPYTSPVTDRFSMSSNHTKALIIDYGAAFMVGGSGIVTPWSKQKGEYASEQVESHGLLYDHLMQVKAYRDMDFVFQSPINGIGTRLYVEMTKLHHRFFPQPPPTDSWPSHLEPIPMPRQISDLKVAAYATGPEQPTTAFLDDLVTEIDKAEKSILIGHMYFHPPKKLLQALINASNRGVQITLITNQLGRQSPGSHLTYAELSRYHAKLLFEGREKSNVEHYEYDIPYTTYHKKVISIDGKVTFTGSANIGQKSLDCSDYEIDFKIASEPFAASTAQVLEQDKRLCHKDSSPDISLKTRLYSSFQSLLTPFL